MHANALKKFKCVCSAGAFRGCNLIWDALALLLAGAFPDITWYPP